MKLTEQSPPRPAVRQVEPRWTPRLVWPIAVGSVQRTSTGSPHLPTTPKGRLSHPSLAIRRRLNLPTHIHQRRSPTHADDVSSEIGRAARTYSHADMRDAWLRRERVHTATHRHGDVRMYIRTDAYVRTCVRACVRACVWACVRACVRACAHHRPIIGWEFSATWASLRNREIVNYKLDYLLANPSRRSLFSFPLSVSPRPDSDCLGYSEKVSIQLALAAHRWTVITLAARRPGMLSPLLRVASGHPLAARDASSSPVHWPAVCDAHTGWLVDAAYYECACMFEARNCFHTRPFLKIYLMNFKFSDALWNHIHILYAYVQSSDFN